MAGLILLAVLLPGNVNAQTPAFEWAKRVASTTTDLEFPLGMALDSQGNSYVTSWFDGTNDFGGVILTNTSGGGQDIFVAKYDAAGALQWAKRAGGNTSEWDAGCGIGVDNAGNVYVTGAFVGTAEFDGLTLTGSTRNEFFLAKYDRAGTVQWVRESTGGSSVYGTAIAVDSEGNSYAIGYADNSLSVTFGTTELASASLSGYSAFLVKYDNTGTVRWAQLMGGPGHTYAVKVAVDAAGNVYVRGSFTENMTIGTSNLVSTGPDDAFIAKFNSAGTLVWARQAGGAGSDAGADGGVVVDSAGNVYISGAFDRTINFGGGISLANVGAVREGFEAFDAFVAKYNSAGVPQWARRAGGTRLDIYWDVALDGQGNLYAAGVLSSDAVSPSGSGGAMVAKYDPAGTLQWAHSASGPPANPISSVVAKVAVDSAGHAFLAGWYATPTTFGTTVLQPQGGLNFFLTKITSGEPVSPDAPVITAQPQSHTVNAGQNVSFSVTATGADPLVYQWRKNGGNLTGQTGPSLSLSLVSDADAGSYDVVVSNSAGSATSESVVLSVNTPPSVTVQPLSQTVNAGQNVIFSVTATGTAPLSYQWRKNEVELSGQTGASLSLSIVTAADAGRYDVVVSNMAGSSTSEAAMLGVNTPPSITSHPQTRTVNLDQSVTFSVTATGTAPLTYQWRKGGVNLAGRTGSSLNLNFVRGFDAGSYDVVVSNIAGSVISEAAMLSVNLPPQILSQPSSQTSDEGGSATFLLFVTGTAPLAYQWRKDEVDLIGATTDTLILSSLRTNQAGSYTVVVTNAFGRVVSEAAVLKVNPLKPPVIVQQPKSPLVNVGQSTSFSIIAGGSEPLSYQWQLNGNDIIGATSATYRLLGVRMDQAGSYTVVVSNEVGTVTSLPATLTVKPATPGMVVAWGWNDAGQTTVPPLLGEVTAIAAGSYHTAVALRDNGRVFAWGGNYFGQTTVPVVLYGATAIAAGYQHTVALKSDGTVFAWGLNKDGQASIPSGLSGVTAIAAGHDHTVALKGDGTVVAWGSDFAGRKVTVPVGLSGVKAIAAGNSRTVALKSDGTVVVWGAFAAGESKAPVDLTGVTAVAAGGSHVVALKNDGTVVSWGANDFGQTTVPVGLSGVAAIAAGYAHTLALKNDGTVVAWGSNTYSETTVPPGLSGVTAIAAGAYHSVALVGSAPSNAPTITAQSIGNGVVLSWPATTTTYQVESTSSLSAPIVWNEVTTSPQTEANSISILLPNAGLQTFFRLVKR